MSEGEGATGASDDAIDWDDPRIFHWTLSGGRTELYLLLAYWFGGAVLFPGLMWFCLWLVSRLHEGLAQGLAWLLASVLLVGLLQYVWSGLTGKPRDRSEASSAIYWSAIAILGSLAFLLAGPASALAAGFENGQHAGLADWTLFLLDNTANVLLLDIPELLLQTRFSSILPNTVVARAITVLIRVLITIGAIELLLELLRLKYRRSDLFFTVRDCYWHIAALPDHDKLELRRVGEVAPLNGPRALSTTDFLERYKLAAETTLKEMEQKVVE